MDRLRSAVRVALIVAVFAGFLGCDQVGVTAADRLAVAATVSPQTRAGSQQPTDFEALPDGGRIELQRGADYPAAVAHIRQHLQEIARAFDKGEFSKPGFVRMKDVPGVSVMVAKRDEITYTYGELPGGGEVRIVTQDPQALEAIHEFIKHMDHGRRDHGGPHRRGTHHDGMQHRGAKHERHDHSGM